MQVSDAVASSSLRFCRARKHRHSFSKKRLLVQRPSIRFSVRQVVALLRASFRPRLATTPLRFGNPRHGFGNGANGDALIRFEIEQPGITRDDQIGVRGKQLLRAAAPEQCRDDGVGVKYDAHDARRVPR